MNKICKFLQKVLTEKSEKSFIRGKKRGVYWKICDIIKGEEVVVSLTRSFDEQYIDLCRRILAEGEKVQNYQGRDERSEGVVGSYFSERFGGADGAAPA